MSKTKKFAALFMAFALAFSMFALTGCATEEEPDTTTEEPMDEGSEPAVEEFVLVEEGKLIAGSETTFPPFESMNGDIAEGFDVDLMEAIGEKLGLEVVIKTEIFDTLIPTLQAGGKFDVIASGMTIKPEREKEIDFSDPYYDSNQSVVMKAGSTYNAPEDLTGLRVGVQSGTTGQAWAEETVPDVQIVPFKNATEAFAAAAAGNVDAIVNDLPVSTELLKQDARGLEVVAQIPTGEQYGFGVSKDNPALRDAINDALAELRADGTYDEIFEKWFGIKP
ncbi:MAG: basic amino acid ABC transporter substrate-binding protein [Coriobacteriia bacterium]|nr:basic amino acid ABC transporter substrate-binding protein [Coriobacteriia bacterium]